MTALAALVDVCTCGRLATHVHELYGPRCFRCHVGRGPYAAASVRVTGSRGAGAARTREIAARQRRWDRDDAAFASLVKDGIEPPHIDGSADLMARAICPEQIVMGKPHIHPDAIRWYEDAFESAPTTPNLEDLPREE